MANYRGGAWSTKGNAAHLEEQREWGELPTILQLGIVFKVSLLPSACFSVVCLQIATTSDEPDRDRRSKEREGQSEDTVEWITHTLLKKHFFHITGICWLLTPPKLYCVNTCVLQYISLV